MIVFGIALGYFDVVADLDVKQKQQQQQQQSLFLQLTRERNSEQQQWRGSRLCLRLLAKPMAGRRDLVVAGKTVADDSELAIKNAEEQKTVDLVVGASRTETDVVVVVAVEVDCKRTDHPCVVDDEDAIGAAVVVVVVLEIVVEIVGSTAVDQEKRIVGGADLVAVVSEMTTTKASASTPTWRNCSIQPYW